MSYIAADTTSKHKPSFWTRFVESLYIPAILKGMGITLRYMLAKKWTEGYPEVKWQVPPGYRGFPELLQHANGVEKCVACGLCEIACPAHAIFIKPGEYPDLKVKDRYPIEFTIDMGRCIVCGYCEEACPVDAIGMSNRYELVTGNLEGLIFKKNLLLSDYDKLQVQSIWDAKPTVITSESNHTRPE